MLFSVLMSFALVPFATAQSSDVTVELKAIQAHLTQSGIIPSLLATFDPSALLSINYPGVGVITPGQALTKEQSAPTPAVTVIPANSSVSLTGTYTITMVDADIVGSDLSGGVNRHWLINGVHINDSTVTNATATAITAYAGPGPAAGSGPHRYVIILYAQPSTFTAPPGLSQPIGVTKFDVNAYAKNSGLGPIIGATYITVEDGTSTISISATSPVISSTLVPTSSGAPASASGTRSGSATPSSTNSNGVARPELESFSLLFLVLAGLVIMIVA